MPHSENSQIVDIEELEAIIQELIENSTENPIIVEGTNDIESLRKLGITGHIISLNQGKAIIDVCTNIAEEFEEVIILTDWDPKGNQLCAHLKKALKANDVAFDTRIRGHLASLLKREIKDVQSLYNYISRRYPDFSTFNRMGGSFMMSDDATDLVKQPGE